MAYIKKELIVKRGFVSLFFDDILIENRRFKYPAVRKAIINSWERNYQLSKQTKDIFIHIIYD